jgi:hypothetical protein
MENENNNNNSSLVNEVLRQGGEPENPEQVNPHFAKSKPISDVIGNSKINFYPELDKVKFDTLLEKTFLIWKTKIIPDFSGIYGTSDLCLILIETPDGVKHSTAAGGVAIKKQIRAIFKANAYPVKVKLTNVSNPDKPGQEYYLFV